MPMIPMEMNWWIVCMILSAFFTGMEVAFVASDRLRHVVDNKRKNVLGFMLETIYSRPSQFLTTVTAGNLIVLVLFVYLSIIIFSPFVEANITTNLILNRLVIIVASAILIHIAGELIPRIIFRKHANLWLKVLLIPAFIFHALLYPISASLAFLSRKILSLFGISSSVAEGKALGRVDLDSYVKKGFNEADEENGADPEVKIFRNALDFSTMKIRDCMVPRADIVAVSSDTDFETLKEKFIETGLSKILVYEDNIDNIIGYIHVWEVLTNPSEWTKNIAPISFVPESMQANKLMSELMQQHKSITVVVDEFGSTSGIVTMEDLVEEIFGEIEDEYDVKAKFVKKDGENEYILSGRIEIDHLNETYCLNLPESDDYSTIAGLLLHHTQRFPKTYETINIGKFTFKILKVTARKIEVVRLIDEGHCEQ